MIDKNFRQIQLSKSPYSFFTERWKRVVNVLLEFNLDQVLETLECRDTGWFQTHIFVDKSVNLIHLVNRLYSRTNINPIFYTNNEYNEKYIMLINHGFTLREKKGYNYIFSTGSITVDDLPDDADKFIPNGAFELPKPNLREQLLQAHDKITKIIESDISAKIIKEAVDFYPWPYIDAILPRKFWYICINSSSGNGYIQEMNESYCGINNGYVSSENIHYASGSFGKGFYTLAQSVGFVFGCKANTWDSLINGINISVDSDSFRNWIERTDPISFQILTQRELYINEKIAKSKRETPMTNDSLEKLKNMLNKNKEFRIDLSDLTNETSSVITTIDFCINCVLTGVVETFYLDGVRTIYSEKIIREIIKRHQQSSSPSLQITKSENTMAISIAKEHNTKNDVPQVNKQTTESVQEQPPSVSVTEETLSTHYSDHSPFLKCLRETKKKLEPLLSIVHYADIYSTLDDIEKYQIAYKQKLESAAADLEELTKGIDSLYPYAMINAPGKTISFATDSDEMKASLYLQMKFDHAAFHPPVHNRHFRSMLIEQIYKTQDALIAKYISDNSTLEVTLTKLLSLYEKIYNPAKL